MTATQARVRSMKARRSGTCPTCRRAILVGARIVNRSARRMCITCAIEDATGKPAPQTRTPA